MAKTPYLARRKNVFYFRLRVPAEHRKTLKVREIFQSLKTENREEATHQALKLAAHYKASLADLRTGKSNAITFSPTTDSTSNTPLHRISSALRWAFWASSHSLADILKAFGC